MWGELCLPLHTHPSALWRGTLEVLAPKKAKEREGGGGRDEGAEGAGAQECRLKLAERCKGEVVAAAAGARKKAISRGWFRCIHLWLIGPARFRCATLLSPAPQLRPPTALPDTPWHCQHSRLLPFVLPVPSPGQENCLPAKFTSFGPGVGSSRALPCPSPHSSCP